MAAFPKIEWPGSGRIGLALSSGPFGASFDLYQEADLQAMPSWLDGRQKADWTPPTRAIYSRKYNVELSGARLMKIDTQALTT